MIMNLFRIIGDLNHTIALLLLVLKIFKTKSCYGISGKTQILYAIVFASRYLDLFTQYVSFYNTAMKTMYLSASCLTLYLIFHKYKHTYEKPIDSFKIEIVLIPSFLMSIYFYGFSDLFEVLWRFSIYLESVAILPQLYLIKRNGQAEYFMAYYLILLGSYRVLYLLNWANGCDSLNGLSLVIIAALVQTFFYLEFLVFGKIEWKNQIKLDETKNTETKSEIVQIKECESSALSNSENKIVPYSYLDIIECTTTTENEYQQNEMVKLIKKKAAGIQLKEVESTSLKLQTIPEEDLLDETDINNTQTLIK